MRTLGTSIAVEELQPFVDWAKKHDIIYDESDPAAYENANLIAKYFIETWKEDITAANLDLAFPYLKPYLKFIVLTPAQEVAKQAGIDLAQATTITSVLSRRQIDQRYLVEDAATVARYLLAQGWPVGPANIDQALTTITQLPQNSSYKIHWVRKLQDREKEILKQREAASKPGEPRISDDDVPKYVPAHLRDHWRKQHAGEKPETAAPAVQRSLYEKLSRDMVADMGVMDKSAAQAFLAKADAWGWEMVYRSLITFSERRRDAKAAAAQLARMGPR